MNIRERTMAAIKGSDPDVIPCLIYSNLLPRGHIERKLRNKGLGLTVGTNVYRTTMPNVSVEEKRFGDFLYRRFHTPVGEVSEKVRVNLKKGTGGQWRVEWMIKKSEDYEAVKFIVEDVVYEPAYDDFLQVQRDLGDDGVVFAWVGYTPLMQVIVQFMGYRKFAVELHRNREEIEDLMALIDKRLEEICYIVAESPAEIIKVGDNTDSMLISPKLFEDYCLPYFQKYSRILHSKGKIVMSHMDGRLKILKDLISKTGLDMIEAFTPPPGGDLPISEARKSWGDGVAIWINIPEVMFLYERKKIEEYVISLLREMAPGKRFLFGITEDIPESRFEALDPFVSTVQKYGKYPLRC